MSMFLNGYVSRLPETWNSITFISQCRNSIGKHCKNVWNLFFFFIVCDSILKEHHTIYLHHAGKSSRQITNKIYIHKVSTLNNLLAAWRVLHASWRMLGSISTRKCTVRLSFALCMCVSNGGEQREKTSNI